MRQLFVITFFMFSAATLFAMDFPGQQTDRTFQVSGRTKLTIKNEDGRTSVKAVSGNEVVVHATKEVHGARTEAEAARYMDKVTVKIQQNGDQITVEAKYPKWHFQIGRQPNVLVHFDITAPAETDVSADVSDGSLDVNGFDGRSHLRAADGKITASGLKGNMEIHASDGDIDATALEGQMDISAADGHVTAADCSGSLKLHTSDGSARLTRFNGSLDARTADGKLWVDGILKSIAAKTSDGSMEIHVAVGSVMEQDWNLRSADGDVDLHLPASFSADVDVETSDGHINTRVPIAMTGSLSSGHITGKMNAGGHLLQIHTSNGDVSISSE